MEDRLTSFELSKKLYEAGCIFDTQQYLNRHFNSDGTHYTTIIDDIYYKEPKSSFGERNFSSGGKIEKYPAYNLLWDICIKYASMFLGNKTLHICGNDTDYNPAIRKHTPEILRLLQQNKKQEAEDYIWANSIFNKEKK